MTLIELIVVVVIIALAASGLSFSLGALNKTNLKSGAARLAAAARFAYNRSIIRGTTVRIAFDMPGTSFTSRKRTPHVTLARAKDERRKDSARQDRTGHRRRRSMGVGARAISEVLKPSYGASPFNGLTNDDGKALTRYTNVALGRRVQVVKLIVPHEPEPLEQGKGAIHFFPSGMTEHAVIQLSDGADAIYSVELHPLTGRCQIYPEAYEPKKLLGDPEHPHESEVRM